jgi:hypothetical protein
MSEAISICIYCYASSPDVAAWMLKFVFVYLANTAVLCYSLTIICCCLGDQLDRWNELKEVLHVQTRAEVAKILLDR